MGNKVSVIVPVYNVEKYIDKCMQSIVSQTYENLEIILVDDGSPDNCGKKCDEYADSDSRIRVIHQENAGVSDARNKGISVATGDYLCFVDSDDYVTHDFVQTLVDNMGDGELSICGFYEDMQDEVIVRTKGGCISLNPKQAMKILLEEDGYRGYLWNKIFRMDIIKDNHIKFEKNIHLWEDVLFVYQYMRHCKSIVYNPQPKYHYVYRENSASHGKNMIKKVYSAIEAKEIISHTLDKDYEDVWSQLRTRFLTSALSVMRLCALESKDKEVLEYQKKSMAYIKKYKGEMNRLTKQDKLSVMLCMIHPALFKFVYRIKKLK